MFNRKFSSNIRRRKRMITSIIILLVVFLGIGYSAFTTDLSINGTLNVSKYEGNTLYGVLEKAADQGTHALKYTWSHQDTMSGVGDKNIYYWHAYNGTQGDTIATEILDRNNVIFANHCWQMIRTTDSGGVKMIYNGETENNQCLNTRGNHVGYESRTTQSMSDTYYYGTSYNYDSTNNVFSLDGTITTGTIQTGQYTCKQATSTGTCTTLYLVDTLSSGSTYYVLALNGNSHYSQFGTLQYNQNSNSLSYVGYMYNATYPVEHDPYRIYYIEDGNTTINSTYYYSDEIDYGNQNIDKYTLINPNTVSTLSDYSTLVGKYVMSSYTSSTHVYYVLSVSGTTIKYKYLRDGNINTSMQVGDSYTDNGDGTYTIDSPTEVTYIDWNKGSYSSNYSKYVCDGASATCTNLRHISSRNCNDRQYYYFGVDNTYKFSKSISYSNGAYTLSGEIVELWDMIETNTKTSLATHHYTCLSTENTCTIVKYVNYISDPGLYYVLLTNGTNLTTARNNMLSSDDVNTKNSVIKAGLDAWYKRYMIDYTDQLEDAIYCNERTWFPNNIGGWKPNGGDISNNFSFYAYERVENISCDNETDKFSLSNSKAQLTYPVGLLTFRELYLINNSIIRKTGKSYWLGSPSRFGFDAYVANINTSGSTAASYVKSTNGVRPAITLKPGTEYVSGTGSMADPYIVE